ncbi:sugar transferase [Myroides odoratimimus]|uniref:sugar transferase n=1 Tax=Myroides odoratimimus TaxID=76832 RepID=UPI0025764893|nr:sugar transferase [Myroides odoratimimus]MDM1514303.1 sugar transferase [Myroides odoratimimus]MEC4043998.1 sugar transferase [Myroides odoratimimus]MEC4151828.1 sugar transferase [Myroides odoratimimus]
MYKLFFKPVFDITSALFGFLLLLPVFIIIMVILFILNDGKAFFLQERPGKNEKVFKIIKFKTMNDKKDKEGNLLPMVKRITPFGAFLRKSSLDEIPQLINIIKGDMSLIGPRPLLVSYLSMYTDNQKIRHNVKPGVTGWAQVNGRNMITWKEKFEMDVWYVNNLSFKLDCIIFLRTLKKIVSKSDIAYSEAAVQQSDFLD